MNKNTLNGATMAAMVAGLFAITAMSSAIAAPAGAGDTAAVKCLNSSTCKGHGSCKQASNACKGQNACKGEGFTMQKTQAQCDAAQSAAKA